MLYVSSACLKSENIAEVIKNLAENEIYNIELSGGTNFYPNIEEDLKSLKRMYNLEYAFHAYFPPPQKHFVVNLASCNDEIYSKSIKHYEDCIEMMKRVGSKVLSIHAGFFVEIAPNEIGKKLNSRVIYNEEKAYGRFCEAYKYLEKICEKNGIRLYLENNVLNAENYKEFGFNNYFMMTDYNSILYMKNQMEFDLLLDLGHLHVSANTLGLDFSEQCAKLKKLVRWIHISENNGIFDEHRPLEKESCILVEYSKMKMPQIDITLETVGNISSILESEQIIKNFKGIY